jgi:predicted transport protein
MQNKNVAKKRLMFIQKEDYNFLAYSTIVLLNSLECTSETKKFKDFRKIAYLVDFINEGGDPHKFDQQQLAKIYARAQIKKKLLHHLIIFLKNKKFISISINESSRTIDLWLNKEEIPNDFLDQQFFQKEMSNVNELKTSIGTLRNFTIKTLADKIFTENNVLTWEV